MRLSTVFIGICVGVVGAACESQAATDPQTGAVDPWRWALSHYRSAFEEAFPLPDSSDLSIDSNIKIRGVVRTGYSEGISEALFEFVLHYSGHTELTWTRPDAQPLFTYLYEAKQRDLAMSAEEALSAIPMRRVDLTDETCRPLRRHIERLTRPQFELIGGPAVTLHGVRLELRLRGHDGKQVSVTAKGFRSRKQPTKLAEWIQGLRRIAERCAGSQQPGTHAPGPAVRLRSGGQPGL